MNKRTAQLRYNPETDRLEFDGIDLHCGMCLDVLTGERTWTPTRLEYCESGWFLVGLPELQPNGMMARMAI